MSDLAFAVVIIALGLANVLASRRLPGVFLSASRTGALTPRILALCGWLLVASGALLLATL